MSDVRSEIVRLPRGKYGVRIIGDDGPPIPRARAGASGIKTSPEQRKSIRQSIQRVLKAMYEEQEQEQAKGA